MRDSRKARPGPFGLALLTVAAVAAAPAPAQATRVGLTAQTTTPSECVVPQSPHAAGTSCQLYAGARIDLFALASRDDGSAPALMPMPFSLLALRGGGARELMSFTLFDASDGDDRPAVRPRRSTDYQLRFDGNADLPPGISPTLDVGVGARLTIPRGAGSGRWSQVHVPVIAGVAWRSLRGRIELRRCHAARATDAQSCAARGSYTVLATRTARGSRRTGFEVAVPPRSLRRYEVAYRPSSRRFATTRRAFSIQRGADGITSYRPLPRSSPFGDR
jgi:hypothetical protein